MGKEKKKKKVEEKTENSRVLVAEFRVSMHCNACERSVAEAISKVKGLEMFMTDMPGHRVVVKGRDINGEKIAKKIRKKTGKKAEILSIRDEDDDGDGDGDEENVSTAQMQQQSLIVFHPCLDSEVYAMFSDENPNACSIM